MSRDPIPAWLRRLRPRTRILAAGRAMRALAVGPTSIPARTTVRRAQRRWRRALNRALRRPPALEVRAGAVREDALLLTMCQWQRGWRLGDALDQLSRQAGCPPIRFVVWNNDPTNDVALRETMDRFGARGALASIEYHSSRVNIGGIARFVVARHLLGDRPGTPFVMLDDDQDIAESFVADVLAQYEPRTFAGFWAFRTKTSYWDREEATDGEEVDYVGTGGSVCDAEIVRDRAFFDRLPDRYGFIEDLWASYFASSRGWRLRKVDTPIVLQDEAGNQYHQHRERKDVFRAYLRERTASGRPL